MVAVCDGVGQGLRYCNVEIQFVSIQARQRLWVRANLFDRGRMRLNRLSIEISLDGISASQRQSVSEGVLYVKDGITEGKAMAHPNAQRIGTPPGSFGVWGGSRSSRGSVRCVGREGTSGAGQETEKKAKAEPSYAPLMTLIVVIEEWICMVLGIICIVSGIVGLAMNPSQNDVAAGLSWLKSMYILLLRATATVCLALGAALVRLGWRGPNRTGEIT
jgi:hypothetical protein